MVTSLCLCRAVRGAVGDGDANCPEVAGIRGICNPRCDFRVLCCVNHLHPSGYGGTLRFPARTPFALVRMVQRGKCVQKILMQIVLVASKLELPCLTKQD